MYQIMLDANLKSLADVLVNIAVRRLVHSVDQTLVAGEEDDGANRGQHRSARRGVRDLEMEPT